MDAEFGRLLWRNITHLLSSSFRDGWNILDLWSGKLLLGFGIHDREENVIVLATVLEIHYSPTDGHHFHLLDGNDKTITI